MLSIAVSEKANEPMLEIVSGKSIVSRDVQEANTLEPREVASPGSFTYLSEEQPENIESPITVRESGSSIVSRDVQEANIPLFTEDNVFDNTTFFSAEQYMKTC